MLSDAPVMDTISLTRGCGLDIPAHKLRGVFPSGTQAELVFFNARGVEISRFDGTVSRTGISFYLYADELGGVTHGSQFVIYVTYPGRDPAALRYGLVIRSEPVRL